MQSRRIQLAHPVDSLVEQTKIAGSKPKVTLMEMPTPNLFVMPSSQLIRLGYLHLDIIRLLVEKLTTSESLGIPYVIASHLPNRPIGAYTSCEQR